MADDKQGLELTYFPDTRRGRATLTAKLNGYVLAVETIDLTKPKARSQFAKSLCKDREGIDSKTIEDELLKIAARLSDRETEMSGPSRENERHDGPRIVGSPHLMEVFVPFPVDALPEPIRSFVTAGAKAIGCDTSYLALPALVMLAAAIGSTRRIQLKRGWTEPAILWGAIVGESGTAKSPAFNLVMRPVHDRQRKAQKRHAEATQQYEANLARYEKEFVIWSRNKEPATEPPVKPEAPQAERFLVSDTTVEALAPLLLANTRGLLMARDELAGFFGSFDRYTSGKGGADAAHWLSMHTGESITVDRKGIPRTIYVPQTSICICGGIQPAILHRALGKEHRESGLAARLLLTCPPRKAKQWTEADIDPAAEVEIARLVDQLFELKPIVGEDGEPRPVVVGLTPDAKSVWKAFYDNHAQEQADLNGDLSAAWSKLEGYAARFALVIHFVRWAANDLTLTNVDSVDVDSMKAGIRLANWFKGEARRVYALLDETEGDREQRRLIEWIERKGGTVQPRDVQMGYRSLREAGKAEAALNALVQAGMGTWESPPTGGRGKEKKRFLLSTVSTVNNDSTNSDGNDRTVDVDMADTPELHVSDNEWWEL